ncbi:MAG: type II toxin-antitoxin system VapC family toxin [Steroidobacteraceae bacterium]
MIVVDASALLEMLLQTRLAGRLMERMLARPVRLHAPHLIDIEVAHALRRLVQRNDITAQRAEQGLADLSQLFIERHGHQSLTDRIWQLRESVTAYDGAYIALAEALDAPLLTCDAKLAHAHGHRAKIDLVGDY